MEIKIKFTTADSVFVIWNNEVKVCTVRTVHFNKEDGLKGITEYTLHECFIDMSNPDFKFIDFPKFSEEKLFQTKEELLKSL